MATVIEKLNTLLSNAGQQKVVDDAGKTSYIPVKIFEDKDLQNFIELSETAVQNVLKKEPGVAIGLYPELVVEHAFYLALISRSLVEKGREYVIQDNGLAYEPPHISSHMSSLATTVFENWLRKVQLIRG